MDNNGLLIIYTGGTIGMSKIDDRQNFLINKEEVLSNILSRLDLKKNDKVILTKRIIDSSQLDYEVINEILEIIETEYLGFKGFLIVGGTNTMAYLQSLLKWHVLGLKKPIILTGAIKSFDEDENEGLNNIKFAINQLESNIDTGIIGIAMNNQLLLYPTSKINSTSTSPYIEIKNSSLEKDRQEISDFDAKLKVTYLKDVKVEIIYQNPFMFIDESCPLSDGLLILAYGQGTFKNDLDFKNRVKKYSSMNKPVVVISQCIYNNLDVGQYFSGTLMEGMNVEYCSGSGIEEGLAYLNYLINNNILLC